MVTDLAGSHNRDGRIVQYNNTIDYRSCYNKCMNVIVRFTHFVVPFGHKVNMLEGLLFVISLFSFEVENMFQILK